MFRPDFFRKYFVFLLIKKLFTLLFLSLFSSDLAGVSEIELFQVVLVDLKKSEFQSKIQKKINLKKFKKINFFQFLSRENSE